MEFQKGERVFLNFDTGGVEKTSQHPEPVPEPVLPAFDFVSDILERAPAPAGAAPAPPTPRTTTNGFPVPKKRTPRVSAFKQQRAAKEQAQAQGQPSQPAAPAPRQTTTIPQAAAAAATPPLPRARFDPSSEKRGIDEENRQRLGAMSEAEIEAERRELMENLSPALIQRFLARSNLDEGSNERDWEEKEGKGDSVAVSAAPVPMQPERETKEDGAEGQTKDAVEHTSKEPNAKKVAFVEPEPEEDTIQPESSTEHDHTHTHASDPALATGSLHFPATPQPPSLDPSDPNFLKSLHQKYFPSLPYNPSTLAWMTPVDPTDTTSPYHPSHSALNATELRFDFKGTLLAPSVARAIPTDRGLHHHADAPEAAGYTIAELAVTARSAVPAQRCMAYQTLGRILYRLGQGEFGVERPQAREADGPVKVVADAEADAEEETEEAESEDVGHYMAAGLWGCIEEGRVIETLTEEANREKGHLTARTFAQEALWNWRRGGGRKRPAV